MATLFSYFLWSLKTFGGRFIDFFIDLTVGFYTHVVTDLRNKKNETARKVHLCQKHMKIKQLFKKQGLQYLLTDVPYYNKRDTQKNKGH